MSTFAVLAETGAAKENMRIIIGYLSLCHTPAGSPPMSRPFGPGDSSDSVATLHENGLRVWNNRTVAKAGLRTLLGYRRFSGVSLYFIFLRLAETREELKLFQDSQNLIFVSESKDVVPDKMYYEFYGQRIDMRAPSAMPIPAAYLAENGWHPFDNFRDACYAAGEAARQTLTHVMVGDLVTFDWLSTTRTYPITPST